MKDEDRKFQDDAHSNKIRLDTHYDLLRAPYCGLQGPINQSAGMSFGSVFTKKVMVLHVNKESFGKGELRFNRYVPMSWEYRSAMTA